MHTIDNFLPDSFLKCVCFLQEVKHNILFLIEMLECFLEPVISISEGTIAFKGASKIFKGKQQESCEIALNIIRTAVQKPAILPHLEHEWRRGSVPPR